MNGWSVSGFPPSVWCLQDEMNLLSNLLNEMLLGGRCNDAARKALHEARLEAAETAHLLVHCQSGGPRNHRLLRADQRARFDRYGATRAMA